MKNLDQILDNHLKSLTESGRKRTMRMPEKRDAGHLIIDGKDYLDFSSNDYLGLSGHPELIKRSQEWAERYGAGAAASRLVTGNLEPFDKIEAKIARAKGSEAGLIMCSGYQTNASVLPALMDGGLFDGAPLVFCDRLNHASMHHGCKAAGIRQIRYRHNDLNHLEDLLKKEANTTGPRFIITETVFSMDGDRTDVQALTELAERYDAFLYVDEAHATGVLGKNGFGLTADVDKPIDLIMGTFSKALGSFGAYMALSSRLKDYLVNRCTGFIYSTALPPAVLGAMDAALDLIPQLKEERARVLDHAERARQAFQAAGLDTGGSSTQIVPVILGSEQRALALSKALEDAGILGIAIRPPTVPKGTSRLRLAFSAAHTEADVDCLIETLLDLVRRYPA